jgi:hypothetical protein
MTAEYTPEWPWRSISDFGEQNGVWSRPLIINTRIAGRRSLQEHIELPEKSHFEQVDLPEARCVELGENPVFKELRDAPCPISRLLGEVDTFEDSVGDSAI